MREKYDVYSNLAKFSFCAFILWLSFPILKIFQTGFIAILIRTVKMSISLIFSSEKMYVLLCIFFFTTSLYFSYGVLFFCVCAFFLNCNNFASVFYIFLILDKLALSTETILWSPGTLENALFTMLSKG